MRIRSFIGHGNVIRLGLALLLGLPLGFLANKIGAGMQNLIPFLLFPLLIGIGSPFTIGARNPHPYVMSVGTGLLVWGGIAVFLLVMAGQTSPVTCASGSCGMTNPTVLTSLLIAYLLIGLIIVGLSALVTSTLARHVRQARKLPH